MIDDNVFQFRSVGYLDKLTGKKAFGLQELVFLLQSCPDSSIFYHTFRALRKMREVHAPYTSDFALWISRYLNEEALSEKLVAIDLREYNTIESLRERIVEVIEEYGAQNPVALRRQADEPFYLCDVTRVVYLTDKFAYDLQSFLQMLDTVTVDSIYYHFIESRLGSELHLDDFSTWVGKTLKLDALAEQIRSIDIAVYTLDEIRSRLRDLVDRHLNER
jgi:hypothetical protein